MSTVSRGRPAGVVIVGTGVAGASAALALRAGGYDGEVTVVGREPHLPYRRPTLSKDVLVASMPIEKALIKSDTQWADAGVVLRTDVGATGGSPADRTLQLSDGEVLHYDSLLLATGGGARHLPGLAPGPRVAYLRDHADAIALRDRLAGAGSVTVIGSGLIGSEIASAAVKLGLPVTVVEAAPLPLARVVPPVIGERLARLQRDNGVTLLLGSPPQDVVVDADGVTVTVADAAPIRSELLVVAVGTVPETRLAAALGAEVANGIVVDAGYRTSVPDVYAAGDCASVPHPLDGGHYRAENWSAAQDQGTAAAQSILGGVPAPTVPWGWSNQFGAVIQFAGWPSADSDVEIDGSVDDAAFVARCSRDGGLIGAVAMARPKELRAVRAELAARVAEVPVS